MSGNVFTPDEMRQIRRIAEQQPLEVHEASGPRRQINVAALVAAAHRAGFKSIGDAMQAALGARSNPDVLAGRVVPGAMARRLIAHRLNANEHELWPVEP